MYGLLLLKATGAQVEVSAEELSFVMKAPSCYERDLFKALSRSRAGSEVCFTEETKTTAEKRIHDSSNSQYYPTPHTSLKTESSKRA